MVIETFQMAILKRGVRKGLQFHSDRGSQYCSNDFRRVLDSYEIQSSMSRKGNCWDNAPAESFFATLKCELVYHVIFKNLDDARRQIFQYIKFF
jgi:transposase InsO family protein